MKPHPDFTNSTLLGWVLLALLCWGLILWGFLHG